MSIRILHIMFSICLSVMLIVVPQVELSAKKLVNHFHKIDQVINHQDENHDIDHDKSGHLDKQETKIQVQFETLCHKHRHSPEESEHEHSHSHSLPSGSTAVFCYHSYCQVNLSDINPPSVQIGYLSFIESGFLPDPIPSSILRPPIS